MTVSAFRFNPPKRRTTQTSRRSRSSRSYREIRYRHIIEEQIGVLNLLRRYSYPGFTECVCRNRDAIQKLNFDSSKSNALQFWILFGSVIQIGKALIEFLQSINGNIVDDTGPASRACAFLNFLGVVILIYPVIVSVKWYVGEINQSYKRGFRKIYGKRISWFELNMWSIWHTFRELAFVRNDAMVRPQSSRDWCSQIMHSVDPPLPIRDRKIPPGLWKRLHALTEEEYDRTLAKPDLDSQFDDSTTTSEYSALSV